MHECVNKLAREPGICQTYKCNEVNIQVAPAELLLKLRVSHLRASLDQDLNSFFEVGNITFITGLLDTFPRVGFGLVSNVRQVDHAIWGYQ
jgi:hypothetical protein